MALRFFFHYPEQSGPDGDVLDAGPLGEVAVAAERAGFHGMSLSEHPIPGAKWLGAGGHQTLDPFVSLGYVAAATERLRLLTYLAVAPYRNPFLLAKSAATLDKLSGGRLTLGLGTGYQKSEFYALGVDIAERNALFDEALAVLPLHWRGEPFSYRGRHFDAREVIARPRPVQDPIPIWIGGNSRRTLERVAARAQGWMPLTGSPQLATTARTAYLASMDDVARKVRDLREMAGPRGDSLDVLFAYQDESIFQPEVDVDRHREGLATLEKTGATWIVVAGPAGSTKASLEFIEAFPRIYKE